MAMTHQQALEVLAKHRGERIVVTTMTSVGLWPQISDEPIDFAYIPSAMGHGTALGLGLALAQPERGAIVVHGDGCTLMSLGALVTMAHNPANLVLIIMDNALYEVTGGQETVGTGTVDFLKIAEGAGIPRRHQFEDVESWSRGAEQVLAGEGPVVIVLKIEGRMGQKTPKAPRPMADQISRLRNALI